MTIEEKVRKEYDKLYQKAVEMEQEDIFFDPETHFDLIVKLTKEETVKEIKEELEVKLHELSLPK